jgi:hypothetical protein
VELVPLLPGLSPGYFYDQEGKNLAEGRNFESLEDIKSIVLASRNSCGGKFQALKCWSEFGRRVFRHDHTH